MSDEEAFQAALDADPADYVTRLVFADWLQERGDERAEGYRAMGELRRCPNGAGGPCPCWLRTGAFSQENTLAPDWFDLLDVRGREGTCAPRWANCSNATRRELDDAAALAFAKLPPARRRELLAGAPVAG